MRSLALALVALGTLAEAARAEPPRVEPVVEVQSALPEPEAAPKWLTDGAPAPLPLPEGTITLGDRMHLVPIHFRALQSGVFDSFAIELDGMHGMPGLHLEVAGTGVIGGVAGELALGRLGRLHSTVLSTPNLTVVDLDDTIVLYRRHLPGNREFSAGLRAGMKLLNVSNLIVAQGYLQAAARFDGIIPANRMMHLDLFAGSGGLLNYNIALDQRDSLAPGLEVSTALVFER